MNRTWTFPIACCLWVSATAGWAMALPIAFAGRAIEELFLQ